MLKYKKVHIKRLAREVILFQKEMATHLEEIGKTPQGRASISHLLSEQIYYLGITGYPAGKIQEHWTYDELSKVLLLLLEDWSPEAIFSLLEREALRKGNEERITAHATQSSSSDMPSLPSDEGIPDPPTKRQRAIRRSVRTLTRRTGWRNRFSMP